jgi:hypothetical protein
MITTNVKKILFLSAILPISCLSLLATQTIVFEYRMGENDPSPTNGGFLSSTLDPNSTNALIRWSGNASPQYSSNTPGAESDWSIDFAGSNSGLYRTANPFGSTNNNYAIEAWINPDVSSGTRPILYIGEQGQNGFGLYQSSGFVFGQLIDTGSTLRAVGTGAGSVTATIGEWTHVALVRNGGTWNVYVNGTIAGGSRAEAATTPADMLTLATWNNGGGTASANFTNWFDGSIDNVRGFTFEAGTFNTNMFAYPASAIPEPATIALLLGFTAFALVGCRRQRD